MTLGRILLASLWLMLLNSVQAQSPQAVPVDLSVQGTVDDRTGYTPPNQPGSNDIAPLIDLTGDGALPPVDATQMNPEIPAEDVGVDSRMGKREARSSIIEEYRPEKFKVYPDDPDSASWEINVRFAFNRAQREMKPLLLLFTSQANKAAMSLSQEVFATKSFNKFVKENLVICYLNYPSNVKDAPRSMQWAKKEFKVAGYPSVLIFNPNGEVDRSIRGYREGRPVDYFKNLTSSCAPTLGSIKAQKESLIKHGFRDWSNSEGLGLFAKFLRRDDYLMTLRDSRGKEWTLSIKQLCDEDVMMARSFPRLDQVVKKLEQR